MLKNFKVDNAKRVGFCGTQIKISNSKTAYLRNLSVSNISEVFNIISGNSNLLVNSSMPRRNTDPVASLYNLAYDKETGLYTLTGFRSDSGGSYLTLYLNSAAFKGYYVNAGESFVMKINSDMFPFEGNIETYDKLSDFPATGETGKIYRAVDTNYGYVWGNSQYTELARYYLYADIYEGGIWNNWFATVLKNNTNLKIAARSGYVRFRIYAYLTAIDNFIQVNHKFKAMFYKYEGIYQEYEPYRGSIYSCNPADTGSLKIKQEKAETAIIYTDNINAVLSFNAVSE